MQKRIFLFEFLCLWVAGVAFAALSFQLADFPPAALARFLFIPFHSQSTAIMLGAVIAQSALQTGVACAAGLWAAHRTCLGTPILETWLRTKRLGRAAFTPLAPIVVIAILAAIFWRLPDLSIFNPRRAQIAAEATAFAQSPASAQLGELARSLMGRGRFTVFSQTVAFVANAINTEIYDRLFMISVAVLLLSQLWDERGTLSRGKILWASILAITLVHAASLVLMQWISAQSHSSMYAGFLTTHDPFWLIEVRRLLRIVPMDLGFGWLYVRYGIESSILANFISAVTASLLLTFVMIHFI